MYSRRGFTLVELLVVIAIIAILAVVVVLTLNPAQLLAQSRDANRLSDMATLNSAISLYSADQSGAYLYSMGNASTSYISIPDPMATTTAGDQCQGLGLPAVSTSTGQSWGCAASSSYRNASSTGWIPINFQSISAGSPIGNLPVDAVNQTTTGLFYSYATNGTQFEISSLFESQKYKQNYAQNILDPYYPEVNAKGSNLAISPLFNPSGLVGWWPLNEGSGSSTIDQSGNGNIGTWSGTPIGSGGTYYGAGKMWSSAGDFDGSTDGVSVPSSNSLNISGPMTALAWIYVPVTTTTYSGIVAKYVSAGCGTGACGFDLGYYTNAAAFNIRSGSNGYSPTALSAASITPNVWHMIAGVYNGSQTIAYLDGVGGTPQSWAYNPVPTGTPLTIGTRNIASPFSGLITDVRVYNRALSPAEIQELYNAEK